MESPTSKKTSTDSIISDEELSIQCETDMSELRHRLNNISSNYSSATCTIGIADTNRFSANRSRSSMQHASSLYLPSCTTDVECTLEGSSSASLVGMQYCEDEDKICDDIKVEENIQSDARYHGCHLEVHTHCEDNTMFLAATLPPVEDCDDDSRQYTSDTTMESFSRKTDMTSVHTCDKSFKCERCMKSFSRKEHLVRHIRVHTGDYPYVCDRCRKSFSQKCDLVRHMKIHITGNTPYKCDRCMKSFPQKDTLVKHIVEDCNKHSRPYKCDMCVLSFYTKPDLNKHIRVHTGVKLHKCDRCMKTFSSKFYLARHIKLHTGDTPYKDDGSMESFSQKSLNPSCSSNTAVSTTDTDTVSGGESLSCRELSPPTTKHYNHVAPKRIEC
jgi:hypothetical protein